MTVAAEIILISVAIQSNGNSELDKKKMTKKDNEWVLKIV